MQNPLKIDELIVRLCCANPAPVTPSEAQWLCIKIRPMLLTEPSLLEISGPLQIVGDIHGQIHDLSQILHSVGLPPYAKWLFLGDYVDRGKNSVEVICLLFALKIKFPTQIYLLRGNHESRDMTEIFGFAEECRQKLSISIWSLFCATFDALPIAAVVNFSILCVHGGISPDLVTLKQIADISRPCDIPQSGFITDLMWSDPLNETKEYAESIRGSTVTWGLAPAQRFMKANKLNMIVRGHQVALNGYEFPFFPNKSIVTVFSASNYDIQIKNKAAYMIVDKDGHVSYKTIQGANLGMPLPRQRRLSSPRASVPGIPRARPDTPRSQMRPRAGSMSLATPPTITVTATGVPSMVPPPPTSVGVTLAPKKRALRTQSQLTKVNRARRHSASIVSK